MTAESKRDRVEQKARSKTLLVISQTYVPDTPAVGQYMHDAAAGMAARRWRVVVLTSGRGYDDPSIKYPARETPDGVEIHHLPTTSLGRQPIPVRLQGQMFVLAQVVLRSNYVGKIICGLEHRSATTLDVSIPS